jgi:hypothetical protein
MDLRCLLNFPVSSFAGTRYAVCLMMKDMADQLMREEALTVSSPEDFPYACFRTQLLFTALYADLVDICCISFSHSCLSRAVSVHREVKHTFSNGV